MCGRFVLLTIGQDFAKHFGLEEIPDLEPRYNIAPTQLIPIIRIDRQTGKRHVNLLKWGLIPSWAKDQSIASKLINARAETVAEKPAFRAAFKYRRCLVPTDGFYEWEKDEKGKQPYLYAKADGKPFAFAGLWEHWKAPDGQEIESFTILITDANDLVNQIHDRMPVMLHEEDYQLWLDPDVKESKLLTPLLRPCPADEMTGRPVKLCILVPQHSRITQEAPEERTTPRGPNPATYTGGMQQWEKTIRKMVMKQLKKRISRQHGPRGI